VRDLTYVALAIQVRSPSSSQNGLFQATRRRLGCHIATALYLLPDVVQAMSRVPVDPLRQIGFVAVLIHASIVRHVVFAR
jgi:hypothetical protein